MYEVDPESRTGSKVRAYDYRQGGVGFADLMILSTAEREGAVPLHTFGSFYNNAVRGGQLHENVRNLDTSEPVGPLQYPNDLKARASVGI